MIILDINHTIARLYDILYIIIIIDSCIQYIIGSLTHAGLQCYEIYKDISY